MPGLRLEDRWTAEQQAKLIELRGRKMPWKEIAIALDRTVEGCTSQYRSLLPEDQRARHDCGYRWSKENEAILERMLAAGAKAPAIAAALNLKISTVYSKIQQIRDPIRHHKIGARPQPPARLLEERDRRLLEERSITQEFFGDPRRGQSALDKKQGVFA